MDEAVNCLLYKMLKHRLKMVTSSNILFYRTKPKDIIREKQINLHIGDAATRELKLTICYNLH